MRTAMTFKRYAELKKSWQALPPLVITAFAIAKCLGLEMKTAPKTAQQDKPNDTFFDESYYENTAATLWKQGAADNLSGDFAAAGGVVK